MTKAISFKTKKEANDYCKEKNRTSRSGIWRYIATNTEYIAFKQGKRTKNVIAYDAK